MVKLRLKRFGRRHRPFYRLNAMDIRVPRNGNTIEELGTYDPIEKDDTKAIKINADRVKYWLSVGAQPSETVVHVIKRAGVEVPKHVLTRIARENKDRAASLKKNAEKAAKTAAAAPKAEEKKAE